MVLNLPFQPAILKRKTSHGILILFFSHAKNKVTDLRGRTRMMELVSGNGFAREGYPVRGLFSIPFAGLDEKRYSYVRYQWKYNID